MNVVISDQRWFSSSFSQQFREPFGPATTIITAVWVGGLYKYSGGFNNLWSPIYLTTSCQTDSRLIESQWLIQQTGSDTADRAAHVDGQKRVRHHAEGCQKPFLSPLMRFPDFKWAVVLRICLGSPYSWRHPRLWRMCVYVHGHLCVCACENIHPSSVSMKHRCERAHFCSVTCLHYPSQK